MYVIEVKAEDLDVNNGFDCIRAGTADATAATVTVTYFLFGSKVGGFLPDVASSFYPDLGSMFVKQ